MEVKTMTATAVGRKLAYAPPWPVIVAALATAALSVFGPRRDIYTAWTGVGLQAGSFVLFQWITTFVGVVGLCAYGKGGEGIRKLLDRVASPRVVYTAGSALIALGIFWSWQHVPGWWWSWQTSDFFVAVGMLVYALSRGRLGNGIASVLAIGVFAVTVGLWEIPYQIGYGVFYGADLPWTNIPTFGWTSWFWHTPEARGEASFVALQVLRQGPAIVGGLLCLTTAALHGFRPKLNVDTGLLLGIYAVCTAAWFMMGFWVDIRWDNGACQCWYHTEGDPGLAMPIERLSKVALAFTFVSAYWPARSLVKIIWGHMLAVVWAIGFMLTTAFLAATWVKAQFGTGRKPYFKVRSIHRHRGLEYVAGSADSGHTEAIGALPNTETTGSKQMESAQLGHEKNPR